MTLNTINLAALLPLVEPTYHRAFARFVETGEADQVFLDYLSRDPRCQEAVKQTFRAQSAALEEFARTLEPV